MFATAVVATAKAGDVVPASGPAATGQEAEDCTELVREEQLLDPVEVIFPSGDSSLVEGMRHGALVADLLVALLVKKPLPPTATYSLLLGTEVVQGETPLLGLGTLRAVAFEPRPFDGTWFVEFQTAFQTERGLGIWTISREEIRYDDPTVGAYEILNRTESVSELKFLLQLSYEDGQQGFFSCDIVLRPRAGGVLDGTQVVNGGQRTMTFLMKKMTPDPLEG